MTHKPLNRQIYFAIVCYTVGILGNSLVSLAMFRLGFFNAVESIEFGVVVGVLIGLYLAAYFWGRQ